MHPFCFDVLFFLDMLNPRRAILLSFRCACQSSNQPDSSPSQAIHDRISFFISLLSSPQLAQVFLILRHPSRIYLFLFPFCFLKFCILTRALFTQLSLFLHSFPLFFYISFFPLALQHLHFLALSKTAL
ncbi:hypothetical protein F5H01DRAFT_351421 [Linnemannia elongata]|nr:hypothetical protein F5H01DRAFT_351421 [Linnemannia elongata]